MHNVHTLSSANNFIFAKDTNEMWKNIYYYKEMILNAYYYESMIFNYILYT